MIVAMCIALICCAQLRRSKLLSQHKETELGATIKSFAYSDDGDEILNLQDNKTEMIEDSDSNLEEFKSVLLNMKADHCMDEVEESDDTCSEKEHMLNNMRSGDFCVYSNALISDNPVI